MRVNGAVAGLNDLCVAIQASDDFQSGVDIFRRGVFDLVQDHDIGKFDLIGQKMNQRAFVFFAQGLTAIRQEIVAREVFEQVHRIDHRDHRVQPCQIIQAVA